MIKKSISSIIRLNETCIKNIYLSSIKNLPCPKNINFNKIDKNLDVSEMSFNGSYLINKEINMKHRMILVDWMIDVVIEYKMTYETLYLAINILDRFLSKNETVLKKFQLLGIICILISFKYNEDLTSVTIEDLIYITDYTYSENEMKQMEIKVLKSIDYKLKITSSRDLLKYVMKLIKCKKMVIKICIKDDSKPFITYERIELDKTDTSKHDKFMKHEKYNLNMMEYEIKIQELFSEDKYITKEKYVGEYKELEVLSKYNCDISLLYYNMIKYKPIDIALSSIIIALKKMVKNYINRYSCKTSLELNMLIKNFKEKSKFKNISDKSMEERIKYKELGSIQTYKSKIYTEEIEFIKTILKNENKTYMINEECGKKNRLEKCSFELNELVETYENNRYETDKELNAIKDKYNKIKIK